MSKRKKNPVDALVEATLAEQLRRTRPNLAALIEASVRAGDPATLTLAAAERGGASPALLEAIRASIAVEHASL